MAFQSWMDSTASRSAVRRKVLAMLHREKSAALRTWVEQTTAAVMKRNALRRGAMTLLHREQSAAFRTWEGVASALLALRRQALSMLHRDKSMALRTWAAQVASAVTSRDTLRRGLLSMLHRDKSMVFRTWAARAVAAKTVLAARRRVAMSMLNRQMGIAWRTWSSTAAAVASVRASLQRIALSMLHRGKSTALRTWIAVHVHRTGALATLRSAAMSLQFQGLQRAVSTWAQMSSNDGAHQRRVGYLLHMWRGSSFHRAWAAWRMVTGSRLNAARLHQRCAQSLRQQGLRQAMNAWLELWASRRRDQRRINMVVHSWQGASMHGAWFVWQTLAATRRRALGVFMSLRLRGVRRCLIQWRSSLELDDSHRIAGILRAMGPEGRAMRRALNSLLEAAEAMRQLIRCTAGLRHRGLMLAKNTWLEYATQRRHTLDALRRCVGRMQRQGLWRAVSQWTVLARHGAARRTHLVTAIYAWCGGKVQRAWLVWKHACTTVRARQPLAAQEQGMLFVYRRTLATWRLEGVRVVRIASVVRKVRTQQARVCFTVWDAATLEVLHWRQRILERLAAVRPLDRAMRIAIAMLREAGAQRRRLYRSAAAVYHRGLRRASSTWMEYAVERKRLVARRESLLRQSVSSFVHRHLRRGLSTWTYEAELMVQRKQLIHRGVASLMHRHLQRGLNAWMHDAALRGRTAHALATLLSLRMRLRFSTWAQHTSERQEAERQKRGALRIFEKRAMRHAMDRSRRVGAQRRRLYRSAAAVYHRGLRRASSTWMEYAVERKRLVARRESLLRQSVSSFVHRHLRRGLSTWTYEAELMVQRKQLIHRGVASLMHRHLQRGLNAWMHDAAAKASRLRSTVVMLRRGHDSGVLRAWRMWRLEAVRTRGAKRHGLLLLREAAARQHLLLRSTAAMYHHGLRRGLNTWRAEAAAVKASLRKLLNLGAVISPEGRALRRAFNSAREMVARVRQLHHSATLHWTAACHRSLTLAKHVWLENAVRRKRSASLARKCLRALMRRGLRRGLSTWISLGVDASMRCGRLATAVRRWWDTSLRCAWRVWRLDAARLRRMAGTANSLRIRSARRCLNTWRSSHGACSQWRMKLARVASSCWRATSQRRLRGALGRLRRSAVRRSTLRRSTIEVWRRPARRLFSVWAKESGTPRLLRIACLQLSTIIDASRARVALTRWRRTVAWRRNTRPAGALRELRVAHALRASSTRRARRAIKRMRRLLRRPAALRVVLTRLALQHWRAVLRAAARLRRQAAPWIERDRRRAFRTWAAAAFRGSTLRKLRRIMRARQRADGARLTCHASWLMRRLGMRAKRELLRSWGHHARGHTTAVSRAWTVWRALAARAAALRSPMSTLRRRVRRRLWQVGWRRWHRMALTTKVDALVDAQAASVQLLRDERDEAVSAARELERDRSEAVVNEANLLDALDEQRALTAATLAARVMRPHEQLTEHEASPLRGPTASEVRQFVRSAPAPPAMATPQPWSMASSAATQQGPAALHKHSSTPRSAPRAGTPPPQRYQPQPSGCSAPRWRSSPRGRSPPVDKTMAILAQGERWSTAASRAQTWRSAEDSAITLREGQMIASFAEQAVAAKQQRRPRG